MSFTAFTPHLLRASMDWMVENRLADRIHIVVRAKRLMARSISTGAELDMRTMTDKPHREARDEAVVVNLGGNACARMEYVGENLQLNLAVSGWKALVTFPIDDILVLNVWNGEKFLAAIDLGSNNAFLRQLDGQGAKEPVEAPPPKDETNRSHLRLVK